MVEVYLWMLFRFLTMLRVRTERRGADTSVCGGCGYRLEGLVSGARCPECGSTEPRYSLTSTLVLDVRTPRFQRWLATLPLVVGAFVLMHLVAPHLAAWSYRVMGYSWETAYLAARAREYGGGRAPFGPPDTLLASASAWIMWPLTVLVICSPLLAFLPRLRWMVAAFAAGTVVALGVCAALWTLPYVEV